MRIITVFLVFIFCHTHVVAQIEGGKELKKLETIQRKPNLTSDSLGVNQGRSNTRSTSNSNLVKGTIKDYKIIGVTRDTTYVDTTLALFKEYKYNYLRKDNFDLMPFANLGQTYNSLSYHTNNDALLPFFGARARHFNYMEIDDINYYHVATPLTELMYKTAFEQGQLLDASITVNTSKQFNFSIAYKGLRSLGKYQHALTSTGNFRFTSSYKSKNNRYNFRGHIVMQDLLNQENGGIIDEEVARFEDGVEEFRDRSIFQVNFEDAENILEGKRFHLDHYYDLISKQDSTSTNILRLGNIISFEDKLFEYRQSRSAEDFFGPSFRQSDINERVTLENFLAQINATYLNNTIGKLNFNLNYNNFNYGYNRVIVLDNQTVPNRIKGDVIALGANYEKSINKLLISGSIGINVAGDFDGNYLNAETIYRFNENDFLGLSLNNNSRAPNYNYLLYQSNYQNYNWFNDFKNINTNQLEATLNFDKLINATVDFTTIDNFTYFTKTIDQFAGVKPFQTSQTVNYFRVKLKKDIRFNNFGIDNTILYQEVTNGNDFLNIPQIVTRNTFYYSNRFFNRALFLQTGIVFKYFTKYNMNAYDPLLAEFYVQNDAEFGGFPMMDFFINAKIRQTRIFLKAEHFNSHFTGYNYFSAPNNPYRDFTVRFGLVWNFFL